MINGPEGAAEQPRGLEPGQPVPLDVVNRRGREKFNWKLVGISFVGSQLGGSILERTSQILTANKLDYTSSYALSMLAFMTGAVVFGFLIPVEIRRRSLNITWHEVWNRILN